MKKKIVALVAAALMTLSASSAFAFVNANLELYRVIWDKTTNTTFETVTDLGSLASLQGMAPGSTIDTAASAFTNVAGYSAANVGDNLMVAYFAYNYTGRELYVSQTGASAAPVIMPSSWTTAGGQLRTYVTPAYAAAAGADNMTGTLVGGKSNSSSFSVRIQDGYFGGAFIDPEVNFTAVPLSSLTSNQITNIYQFTGTNLDESTVGTLVMSLTTDTATGMTSIAPAAATPIPPAFFLMGSGLLGMVGLRRKQRA